MPDYPMLREMVLRRNEWKDDVRSNLLGAFGEYMCGRIAEEIGVHNAWTRETSGLVGVVNSYFDKSLNITFKDLNKSFSEVLERCKPQVKINYAKRHVSSYYPHRHIEIYDLIFDADQEFGLFISNNILLPKE